MDAWKLEFTEKSAGITFYLANVIGCHKGVLRDRGRSVS